MRGENMPKIAYHVVKSPQFYPFYRQSLSLHTTVTVAFKPEIKLVLLRMPILTINKVRKLQ